MSYKLTQIRCNLGIDTISRKSQCAEVMVSVAPASRQLPAFSWNSNTAGKFLALPRHAAASVRQNPQPVRHQLEPPGDSKCVTTAIGYLCR